MCLYVTLRPEFPLEESDIVRLHYMLCQGRELSPLLRRRTEICGDDDFLFLERYFVELCDSQSLLHITQKIKLRFTPSTIHR
jgi:hypothetical protein